MSDARKESSALKASMYVIAAFLIICVVVGLLMNGIHANPLSATGQRIELYYSSTGTYSSPVPEFPANVSVFLVIILALVWVAIMIASKRRGVVSGYVG
jgi:flagellar biosynthesis protein FliQ